MVGGLVSSLQTFGEYASWHPHWHTIVLEGGFDRWDRFVFIPIGASAELAQLWRCKVVGLFTARKLLNAAFAEKLLGWTHSGFSIESNTKIYTDKARESLCQYIVRASVSLEKLYRDWHTMLPHGVLGVLVSPKHPRFTSGALARAEEGAFQG